MDDDLNTAQAQAAIFDMVRKANVAIDAGQLGRQDVTPLENALQSFEELFAVLKDDDGPKVEKILDWARTEGREQEITDDALALVQAQQVSNAEIEKRISEMEAARRARDFKTSDAIRAELGSAGVLVEITKDGVRWRRK